MKKKSLVFLLGSISIYILLSQPALAQLDTNLLKAPLHGAYTSDAKALNLKAITNFAFWPESIDEIVSTKDGRHYTSLSHYKYVFKYSYETGQLVDTLLSPADYKETGIRLIFGYTLNADENKILFYSNKRALYRHSFIADYYVYDIAKQELTPVSESGSQELATFSPDGKQVAFVRDNNIYIKNLRSGTEKAITDDGQKNKIINGKPDWVYEEEFAFAQGFEWSPDSRYIAYYKFDESRVKEFEMMFYYGLYPSAYRFKYPKAGEDNSLVSVHVYDSKRKTTQTMDVGKENDQYIPRFYWTKGRQYLAIFRLNRLQNHLELLLSDIENGKSRVIYEDKNGRYIDEEAYNSLAFLNDGEHFVVQSERKAYNQLYLYNLSGEQVSLLTPGQYDVMDYYGFDPENKRFYYQSAEEGPLYRAVYSVDWHGENKEKLSTRKGTNEAHFSEGMRYYINTFSCDTVPDYITLHHSNGQNIRILEDNSNLRLNLRLAVHTNKLFFQIPTSRQDTLNAWMLHPPDFDTDSIYPLVITQYNGPNSQEVLDEFSFGWERALAQEGFIVIAVDSRGTGARGERFKKQTYKQLGKLETEDLIDVAKYLGKLSFIDEQRIGIWGWSYGGYTTCLCMTIGADYFDTGVAIAPVTNWRYYDNIYTERFMALPRDNAEGYDMNSPINHVKKLRGNLLLIHGSGDDNVHLQNTLEMAEHLVQANKDFDMHIYTNRNHSIYGGNTRYHLFNKVINYFKENL